MMRKVTNNLGWRLLAVAAIVFGVLTITSGGAVLFFDGKARAAAGDYVDFVLWFNFLAGFAYIIAGICLWLRWLPCAPRLSVLIAVSTLLVFAAFGVHVVSGGAYEVRTLMAMSIRSGVWLLIAMLASRWSRLPSSTMR